MAVQPIKIAILAMGGEGGGVLADWIVDLGEHNGYLAQTTSVPGVAQRTGATIYYVELYPEAEARADGATPVLALMPLPGDVDLVLCSELMEAGRAVQRGLVTDDRTTLIASSHRVYSIAEKSAMGDGRVDSAQLLAHAGAAAKRFICFDMAAAAEKNGSVISAVLFGALAASGALPFTRAQFEQTIERGGVGVKPSLKAFGAAWDRVEQDEREAEAAMARPVDRSDAIGAGGAGSPGSADGAGSADRLAAALAGRPAPQPKDPAVRSLVERVQADFPAALQPLLLEGVRRLIDYQDPDYATLYLDRMAAICRQAGGKGGSDDGGGLGDGSGDGPDDGSDGRAAPGPDLHPGLPLDLASETARHLALWMSYEDTARVAALKTRETRFDRVRREARASDDQLVDIHEFMHPRLQEICETLPAGAGRWLMNSGLARRLVERMTRKGRIMHTNSVLGFLMLSAVARAGRWRRSTLRYEAENGRIEAWLAAISERAARDPAVAIELARCQRLVKGYSDTHERGVRNYEMVMDAVRRAGSSLAPATLREWCDAALADEHGKQLQAALARHALS